jgi:hypothetical protein
MSPRTAKHIRLNMSTHVSTDEGAALGGGERAHSCFLDCAAIGTVLFAALYLGHKRQLIS